MEGAKVEDGGGDERERERGERVEKWGNEKDGWESGSSEGASLASHMRRSRKNSSE
jgi:hypothetical protein